MTAFRSSLLIHQQDALEEEVYSHDNCRGSSDEDQRTVFRKKIRAKTDGQDIKGSGQKESKKKEHAEYGLVPMF